MIAIPITGESEEGSIAIRKRAWYARHGAGRTFVQDGFDARTGDEREPGSNPENRERGHGRARRTERVDEGRGASERARGRREREKERKRKAKRRKLKPATGLRNTHTT